MNFLGCDGVWLAREDGSTICQGQMKTFTVQEMREFLTPAMTIAQKAQITGGLLTTDNGFTLAQGEQLFQLFHGTYSISVELMCASS
ncbi:hypothetical protein [Pseudomonas aeruginosa]|uniref:hypothetical protein n=1 Tax=Pseudomonas aeruginosa TaxID=287 RepID=UPI001187469D|nr:hypothetical protein [Pseudomonas aeruginosa]